MRRWSPSGGRLVLHPVRNVLDTPGTPIIGIVWKRRQLSSEERMLRVAGLSGGLLSSVGQWRTVVSLEA